MRASFASLTGLVVLVGPVPLLAQQPPAAASDSARDATIAQAAWLGGCWAAVSADGRNAAEEQWMAPRGGLMVGMSRSVRAGTARDYELLTIRVDDDGHLVYRAAPSGQDVTDFTARAIEPGHLEFVNPEHDFPQKIVYARLEADLIEAAVFGEADGAEPAFLIPYRRVRCPGH